MLKPWALRRIQKVKSMVFLDPTMQSKPVAKVTTQTQAVQAQPGSRQTTKAKGDAAEAAALDFLQAQGLRLLQRNYRTPGRGGGEIDLILQESDSTVVFVEVRKRSLARFGGAMASVDRTKQRRLIFAARYFLSRWRQLPPCRF